MGERAVDLVEFVNLEGFEVGLGYQIRRGGRGWKAPNPSHIWARGMRVARQPRHMGGVWGSNWVNMFVWMVFGLFTQIFRGGVGWRGVSYFKCLTLRGLARSCRKSFVKCPR